MSAHCHNLTSADVRQSLYGCKIPADETRENSITGQQI